MESASARCAKAWQDGWAIVAAELNKVLAGRGVKARITAPAPVEGESLDDCRRELLDHWPACQREAEIGKSAPPSWPIGLLASRGGKPAMQFLGQSPGAELADLMAALGRVNWPPAEWKRVIVKAASEAASDVAKYFDSLHRPLPQAAYDAENRILRIGQSLHVLDPVKSHVVEALVEHRALDQEGLRDKSGVKSAPRVLRGIVETIPDANLHIKLPGTKGKGGFSTSIVFEEGHRAPMAHQ